MRCEGCAALGGERYWPLDHEFWDYKKGLSKCRACWNAYQRGLQRKKRGVEAKVSAHVREYQRDWAARKRQQEREAEGRQRYERRKKAA
jgi:Skp family chaperone for outer membrane proteins